MKPQAQSKTTRGAAAHPTPLAVDLKRERHRAGVFGDRTLRIIASCRFEGSSGIPIRIRFSVRLSIGNTTSELPRSLLGPDLSEKVIDGLRREILFLPP